MLSLVVLPGFVVDVTVQRNNILSSKTYIHIIKVTLHQTLINIHNKEFHIIKVKSDIIFNVKNPEICYPPIELP